MDSSADTSLHGEQVVREVLAGESTPISSGSTTASSVIFDTIVEKAQPSSGNSHKASLSRAKIQLQSEIGAINRDKEQHKVRLYSLRKELNHIKATDWQFESIEKLIGRANQSS